LLDKETIGYLRTRGALAGLARLNFPHYLNCKKNSSIAYQRDEILKKINENLGVEVRKSEKVVEKLS
jgi:hypothetical protein